MLVKFLAKAIVDELNNVLIENSLAMTLRIKSLKTNDAAIVTEIVREIIYFFKVTNIGQVPLVNVTLTGRKLGSDIQLDKSTLAPGESTSISKKYEVTAQDMKKGELINVANVSGKTKKGSLTTVSSVTNEGRDVLEVKQPIIDKILPKTATEMYSLIALGIGILLLGVVLRFVSRRKKA